MNVPTLTQRLEQSKGAKFGEDEAYPEEPSPGFGTAFLVGKQFVMKCLETNCPVFFENNDLNFYEHGNIHQITFPKAGQCVKDIQLRAHSYPQFLSKLEDEKCQIQ